MEEDELRQEDYGAKTNNIDWQNRSFGDGSVGIEDCWNQNNNGCDTKRRGDKKIWSPAIMKTANDAPNNSWC